MGFKVIFRETFLSDLEGIVKSVARLNPDAGRELGLMIIQACEGLNFFPERHPRLKERSGIRRVIVKNTSRFITASITSHAVLKF